jgi:hypothetical protein
MSEQSLDLLEMCTHRVKNEVPHIFHLSAGVAVSLNMDLRHNLVMSQKNYPENYDIWRLFIQYEKKK